MIWVWLNAPPLISGPGPFSFLSVSIVVSFQIIHMQVDSSLINNLKNAHWKYYFQNEPIFANNYG